MPLALSELVGMARSVGYGYEPVGSAVMRPRARKSERVEDKDGVIKLLEPEVE